MSMVSAGVGSTSVSHSTAGGCVHRVRARLANAAIDSVYRSCEKMGSMCDCKSDCCIWSAASVVMSSVVGSIGITVREPANFASTT